MPHKNRYFFGTGVPGCYGHDCSVLSEAKTGRRNGCYEGRKGWTGEKAKPGKIDAEKKARIEAWTPDCF